jgi:hypothetical protein
MKITNEYKTRTIEFIKLESAKEHYPSHRVQILVETENIKTNFNNYTWLSVADIEQFLIALADLDKYRTGQAVLESMYSDELKLTFQPIDTLGHLSVTLHFVKEERTYKNYSYDIKVEFQIDATCLPTVRNDFLALINNSDEIL